MNVCGPDEPWLEGVSYMSTTRTSWTTPVLHVRGGFRDAVRYNQLETYPGIAPALSRDYSEAAGAKSVYVADTKSDFWRGHHARQDGTSARSAPKGGRWRGDRVPSSAKEAPRIGHRAVVVEARDEREAMTWNVGPGATSRDNLPAVMHNNQMERQLVVKPVGASAELQIAPVTPISANAAHHLHLGSQDLVRVAGFAVESGFRLVRFNLADRSLAPLDRDEEEAISDALVSIFEQYDAREVRSALQDEFDGLFVVGIELLSLESGQRIHLRREGYIDTSAPDEATNLLARAWRKLRLA